MEPTLDKIIGCSNLNKAKLSSHYATGACAFASHGFLSIVIPGKKQRFDFKIADDGKEISALTFSTSDNVIAVGELGSNSRLFIFTFSEHFDIILSKTEIKTKENGFSYLALNYRAGKLITIGNDSSPFLLLWDLTQPRPVCIGYYHLPLTPEHVIFSPDTNFAIVSGNKLLKVIDTSIQYQSTPAILKMRNFNIGKYKSAHFVSAAVAANPPYNIYALTATGTLCIIDSTSVAFASKTKSGPKALPPVLMTPINLNSGDTSSIVLDKKIILVGTKSGSILAIKKDGEDHKIFGSFTSDGKQVMAIGLAERMIAAAYDDGDVIFWQRKINSKPLLSLPSHRGPICSMSLAGDNTIVLSGGSDGTVREWRIQKNHGLVGKSSQELICQTQVCTKFPDFLSSLTGVRCISSYNNYVFAGDNLGVLHVLSLSDLSELQRVIENKSGIFAMSVHPTEPLLVTGGADGAIRLYKISTSSHSICLSRVQLEYSHNTAVIDVTFAGQSIISCSKDGVKFMTKDLQTYATYQPEEPVLSLSAVPNERYVVAGGCDHSVLILKVSNGKKFRQYKLSMSAYPLHISVDRSGLFIAVAMSDGSCLIVDIMSGDTVDAFYSMSGMTTQICYHEDDILLSSISGCIMRWTLPAQIHNIVAEKMTKGLPIQDLIGTEEPTVSRREMKTAGSVLNFAGAPKACLFKAVDAMTISNGQTVVGEELDNTSDDQTKNYDAPRPSVSGDEELKVDEIVRASFAQAKKDSPEIELPSVREQRKRDEGLIIVDGAPSRSSRRSSNLSNLRKKAKEASDPFTVEDDQPVVKAHVPKKQKISKVQDFQQTMDQFGEVVTHVKELLAYKPATQEEARVQSELRMMYESLQKEGLKSEWFEQMMKSYMIRFFDFIKHADD